MYRLLADAIVVLHLAYVGFVVLGLLLILLGAGLGWEWVRNFWLRGIHFLMIAVVVSESLLDITCPMTTWEDDLRTAAGENVSEGTFIGRLAHRLLFVPDNGAAVPEATLTAVYCLFGAAVLGTLVWIPPRWPRLASVCGLLALQETEQDATAAMFRSPPVGNAPPGG